MTPAPNDVPLVELIDLKVHFPLSRGPFRKPGAVRAVDGISLKINRGETVSLVGESGCGKSTVARAVVGLERPTEGTVRFDGRNRAAMIAGELARERRRIQMVFQDPYASLNPRMTVASALEEPIRLHGLRPDASARKARVRELMDMVELAPSWANRYPHEFSGGQRQRIGIARALACEPELLVCDEPVSALDVSIQAQVMRLLKRLQQELGLAYLFIAHGLGVVRQISDQVAVMYLGRIVEQGAREQVFANPRHAYTRALISAAPLPDPVAERTRQRIVLAGDLPSPISPPAGCAFSTRCPVALDACRADRPAPERIEPGHRVACIRHAETPSLLPLIDSTGLRSVRKPASRLYNS